MLRLFGSRDPVRPPRCLCDLISARTPWIVCQACSDVAAQFRPKCFGDEMRIVAVADNLGTDEDDQFGAGVLLVLMRKGVTEALNLVEQGNPVPRIVLLFADQSGQQDRLAGRHGNRTLDLS